MFKDARALPETSQVTTDVCIIGAGPAGITLTREFIGTSTGICLLESGGFEFDKATQALCKGRNIGHPYYDLDVLRLRRFGGASNVWSGVCRPLDEIDFAKRSIPHSGWPFDKAHLDPFYRRAHVVCQLGPYDYEPAHWEAPGYERLPLHDDRVFTAMYQRSPTHFGDVYREDIDRAANIEAYLFANVVDIELNASGNAVTRVHAATLGGKKLTVTARAVVVAAGAIENARLLLACNRVHKKGIGNDHDLVGRFFMEHPSVPGAVLLASDPEMRADLYSGRVVDGVEGTGFLTLAPSVLRREEIPNIRSFVTYTTPDEAARKASKGVLSAGFMWNALMQGDAADAFTEHLQNVITELDDVLIYGYERAFRPVKGLFTLDSHIEQAPNPDSRVTLASERDALGMRRVDLAWRFGDLERKALQRASTFYGLAVGGAGLGRVKAVDDVPDTDWPPGVRGGWHQMGTTRMDPDPRRGVVDENCRVHGVVNLFVAGSSVFCTSGYTNPTLTLVALTLRLADHLKRVV